MKTKLISVITLAALHAARLHAADAKLNDLSAPEQKAGWRLLFDGKSTAGWRSFKKPAFPDQGWEVQDGLLHKIPKAGGGDIITDAIFENFDLRWEWKVAPGANSGLKYFVTEQRDAALGHEYQLIDDERNADAKHPSRKRITAAFYDVLKPTGTKPKLAGEWNQSRVLVNGDHVEHWLNGDKVLEYELGGDEVKAAVAQSKFKNVEGFGMRVQCHILLQDHGDEIWFRNVKILQLGQGAGKQN